MSKFSELNIDDLNSDCDKTILLGPHDVWVPDYVKPESNKKASEEIKCTCGIEAIGGGIHSDWCDKGDRQ